MKQLVSFLLLFSVITTGIYAQCDVGIQVQANSFDVNIKSPQSGSTCAWTTDNGQSGSGLYNALGALALEGSVAAGGVSEIVTLNGLPAGLYVCQVLRDEQVLGTTKLSIVKN